MLEPRQVCTRCRRPVSVCYCAALPHLPTQTKVVILQHPREREKPIGTARMASLCLPNAELHVGVRWEDDAKLARALGDPGRTPILLYPGPGAIDILAAPPAGPVTLVVVDGTWSQAKSLVRDNPVLQALPRYAFAAPEISEYRIRKEPREDYCSTIEALMHVLGVLEGDQDKFRALLAPFRAMVDAQLACQQGSSRRTTLRQPKPVRPPKRPLPADTRWDDLVVLVGEANAWPHPKGAGSPGSSLAYSQESASPRDELVHLVLHRLATNETFARVIAPQKALSPTTTFHTALPEATLVAGVSPADAMRDLAAWLRPTDVVCAWGHYGGQLVAEAGGELPAPIDLRAAAYAYQNRKIGTLEAYGRSFGEPVPVAAGRAGERAALLANIVRAWRS